MSPDRACAQDALESSIRIANFQANFESFRSAQAKAKTKTKPKPKPKPTADMRASGRAEERKQAGRQTNWKFIDQTKPFMTSLCIRRTERILSLHPHNLLCLVQLSSATRIAISKFELRIANCGLRIRMRAPKLQVRTLESHASDA